MSKKKSSISARDGDKSISITQEIEELPSPETLQKYSGVDPKFADFVIQYTEREQNHRHTITNQREIQNYKILHKDIGLRFWALMVVAFIMLSFLGLSAWLFSLGNAWSIVTAISTVIASFITLAKIFIRPK